MLIFPVEYSSLSTKALKKLISNIYPIGKNSSIQFLKRGFNDTYLITENNKKYILRVYKHNWRTLESIETEINTINYLKENLCSVSFPIKNKQGAFIQKINAPEGERYAVLFSFAEGHLIRKLTLEQSYLLGIEVGKIHLLTQNKFFGTTAQDYDIDKQFKIILKTLKPILVNYPEQYAYLLQLKDDFINTFNNIDKNELGFGICHGDLQAENFHIDQDNKFTFFDFDFFGKGYLAYDIGVFIWYDHKNKTPETINSFLKGYQTQRNLTETELKLIPYFSTLRALFQMTLYCNISNGQDLPLWPAQQVADFIKKVNTWHDKKAKGLK